MDRMEVLKLGEASFRGVLDPKRFSKHFYRLQGNDSFQRDENRVETYLYDFFPLIEDYAALAIPHQRVVR